MRVKPEEYIKIIPPPPVVLVSTLQLDFRYARNIEDFVGESD